MSSEEPLRMDTYRLPVAASNPPGQPDDTLRARLARELRERIQGEVRFGRHDRMLYATDASLYQIEPLGVVTPRSVDETETIVRFAEAHDLALLPRGGGTSLAGQTVSRALVVDFSAWCRRIIEIDAAARTCRVEPGVVLDQLNRELASRGLFFGPDVATSSHATLGGMIGNNSAGARSILYGRTVENLLGMKVVLADGSRLEFFEGATERDARMRDITERLAAIVHPLAGEIRARFPRTLRRVDGYNLDLLLDQLERSTPGTFDRVNLAHLVCGSEGTLAVMTEATLRLVDLPRSVGLAIITFSTLDAALEALGSILETGPSAVELLDDMVIALARENTEHRRYVDLLPHPRDGVINAVLYVEYSAACDKERAARFDELRARFPSHPLSVYLDGPSMARAWKLRKAGEPLLHGLPGDRKPVTFIEDTAVAPERLPAFVREFRAIVEAHGTKAAFYAHASVGCLHIRPLIDVHDAKDLETMQRIAEEATDLVRRYEGALSGEHGDGRVRSPLLERFFGRELCRAFRDVKAVFDPKHRLNPGNIVAPEPMTAHLRVHPDEKPLSAPDVRTFYHYEREHGFISAVEQCNGAGVCRRMQGGTMCPSYRATLDERHATRGRGNALRLAITGQFSADGMTPAWNDPETHATLDLCLSCKACKSECPSNVDIAKLKAEFTAQAFRAGRRIPLRTRLFGRVRALNRFGSGIAPLANFMAGLAPSRWLAERVLGIDRRRSLPPFARSLFHRMKHRADAAPHDSSRPTVLLLPDCFHTFNEPHIGEAAVEVLEAFGYRVVVPRLGCCGRSMISLGLLEQATTMCRATANALLEAVARERAVAVLALEPSCLSAIKDDWRELRLEVDRGRLDELATMCRLVEDFLDDRWEAHPVKPALQPGVGATVLLHGHCHQKALWGVETSARLLKRIVGERLRVLETGCCGMAGSFGFARERFDLSMKIGEETLFPALREAPEAVIIAPGTSCRHQILDGVGRHALHPIELVRRMIVQPPKSTVPAG